MYYGGGALKIMLITVAGMASRFSQSIGKPCLKCLYHKFDIRESLLYHMLSQNLKIDKYVIVGGFQYDELKSAINQYFGEFHDRIILVKNEKYKEYGSGYSLYLGLEAVREYDYEDLVFAEGDLWVDDESFKHIWNTYGNVITCNSETILADKSVAFYYDIQYHVHYIFDTEHSMLEIKEPFEGIFNSGQIWKFSQRDRVLEAMNRLTEEQWRQTNLCFIQQYFGELSRKEYEIVTFQKWINCNTIDDFESIERWNVQKEEQHSTRRGGDNDIIR